jgi:hypothetical protein
MDNETDYHQSNAQVNDCLSHFHRSSIFFFLDINQLFIGSGYFLVDVFLETATEAQRRQADTTWGGSPICGMVCSHMVLAALQS